IRGLGKYENIRKAAMLDSPIFAVRTQFNIERPSTAILLREVPRLFGDGGRLDEELVRLVLETLAGPGDVDHGVNNDVGDVNALWPELPRHRLGQNALRSLGWSEAGEGWSTPQSGRISCHDDIAVVGTYHCRREATGQVKQSHRVDLKIAVKHGWIDFQE